MSFQKTLLFDVREMKADASFAYKLEVEIYVCMLGDTAWILLGN